MPFTPDPKLPDLTKLKSVLLTSGLSEKNQPLYQVINQLIEFLQRAIGIANTNPIIPSGGGGSTTVIENHIDFGSDCCDSNEHEAEDSLPYGAVLRTPYFTWDMGPELRMASPTFFLSFGTGTRVFEWRPVDYLTQNGTFRFNTAQASNLPDPRRDDVFSLGFNLDNLVPNIGAIGLVFESHCSSGTGCGTPQSEIFFTMSAPNGGNGRPLGFFLDHSVNEFITVIARAHDWTFFNQAQTQGVFNVGQDGLLTMMHPAGQIVAPVDVVWATQNGTDILAWDTSVGRPWFSPNASCVIGSLDGSRHILLNSPNLRMEASAFLNDDGTKTRGAFGNGGDDFWTFSSGDAIPLEQTPTGTAANISVVHRTKGTGDYTVQMGDVQGFYWVRTGKMQFGRGSIPFSGNDDIIFCNNQGGSQTKVYVTAGQAQVSDLQQWTDNAFVVLARVEADGEFQAQGYKSQDGSVGQTVNIDGLVFKNGILTSAVGLARNSRVLGMLIEPYPEFDYNQEYPNPVTTVI